MAHSTQRHTRPLISTPSPEPASEILPHSHPHPRSSRVAAQGTWVPFEALSHSFYGRCFYAVAKAVKRSSPSAHSSTHHKKHHRRPNAPREPLASDDVVSAKMMRWLRRYLRDWPHEPNGRDGIYFRMREDNARPSDGAKRLEEAAVRTLDHLAHASIASARLRALADSVRNCRPSGKVVARYLSRDEEVQGLLRSISDDGGRGPSDLAHGLDALRVSVTNHEGGESSRSTLAQ